MKTLNASNEDVSPSLSWPQYADIDNEDEDQTTGSYCSLTEGTTSSNDSVISKTKTFQTVDISHSSYRAHHPQDPSAINTLPTTSDNYFLDNELHIDSSVDSFHTAADRLDNDLPTFNDDGILQRAGASIDDRITSPGPSIIIDRIHRTNSAPVLPNKPTNPSLIGILSHLRTHVSLMESLQSERSSGHFTGSGHWCAVPGGYSAAVGYVTSGSVVALHQGASLQRTSSLPSNLHRTLSLPSCPICLEPISYRVSTSCEHTFCAPCLLTVWEMQTNKFHPVMCPYCREIVRQIRESFTAQEAATQTDERVRMTEELTLYNARFHDGPRSLWEMLQGLPQYLVQLWDSEFGSLVFRWLLLRVAAEVALWVWHVDWARVLGWGESTWPTVEEHE